MEFSSQLFGFQKIVDFLAVLFLLLYHVLTFFHLSVFFSIRQMRLLPFDLV